MYNFSLAAADPDYEPSAAKGMKKFLKGLSLPQFIYYERHRDKEPVSYFLRYLKINQQYLL